MKVLFRMFKWYKHRRRTNIVGNTHDWGPFKYSGSTWFTTVHSTKFDAKLKWLWKSKVHFLLLVLFWIYSSTHMLILLKQQTDLNHLVRLSLVQFVSAYKLWRLVFMSNFKSICFYFLEPLLWSDPKTWPGGLIPGVGDASSPNITIPCGIYVILNLPKIKVGLLRIMGKLEWEDEK